MASLPDPPPGLDLTETKVPGLLASACVTWALGVACVGLRFFSRRLTRGGFWWDDWIVLIALIWASFFFFFTTCYMVPRGLGLHVWAAPFGATKSYFFGLYVTSYAYTLSIFTTKLAILALYWRIFHADQRIRWPLRIFGLFLSIWTVILFLVLILQCQPASAFWDRFDPIDPPDPSQYKCGVETLKFFLANSSVNTLTDVLLMLVPVPFIWNLTLLKPQKIALIGIFALGLFVTIVSIVRIYFTINLDVMNPDVIWPASDATQWTLVEVNVAIICACLPSLKPIMTLALRGRVHNTQSATSRAHHGSSRKALSAFSSTKQSSRAFRPDNSFHGTSDVPLSTPTSISNDTQPFARVVERECDADPDMELTEMASRKPSADFEESAHSRNQGGTITKNVKLKAVAGTTSGFN